MGKREEKPQVAPDREGKFPLGSVMILKFLTLQYLVFGALRWPP